MDLSSKPIRDAAEEFIAAHRSLNHLWMTRRTLGKDWRPLHRRELLAINRLLAEIMSVADKAPAKDGG